MKLNDPRVRYSIFLLLLAASAFNAGMASEKLDLGLGTGLTVTTAVLGAIAALSNSALILAVLWKQAARSGLEPGAR